MMKVSPLIDVIITENTRPPSGCGPLTYYMAGGVYLSLVQKGFAVNWADVKSGDRADHAPICCYGVFFGNKVSAFEDMQRVHNSPNPPRQIICFGPFAAAFYQEILRRELADIVVMADPEFVIPQILSSEKHESSLVNIPNLAYWQDKKVYVTAKHSFPELDQIPFVAPYLHRMGHQPAFMLSARGCQYHCVFCERNAIWGGGVRQRSIENVLKEIEELVLIHRVPLIRFLDEDIAADAKRLVKLCEGIRRIPGQFTWECSACVDSVSEKILLLMGHSGCSSIHFGVESGSEYVLRRIGKRYTVTDIQNAVLWAREAKIYVEVMLTIGNPDETELDRKKTFDLLDQLRKDIGNITTNRVLILPGTPLYRRALREGRFTEQSFFEDRDLIFYDEPK